MNDCTLLVNSYDGGEDLWEGFFTTLTHAWPSFDLPVVLNTESKSYDYPGITIRSFGLYPSGQRVPWATRLRETLKRIDTEFILFFLDDFWLDAPVDAAFFEKTRQWMRDNDDVAYFSFQPAPGPNIQDTRFERFEKRGPKVEYRLNCQVALWRRTCLIDYLRNHESPWEWERYGSIRSRRYKESMYTLREDSPAVFSYDKGGCIYRGRWCRRVVEPLREKYHLNIDFAKRGFHEDWLLNPPKRKRHILVGIKNRFHILRSIL